MPGPEGCLALSQTVSNVSEAQEGRANGPRQQGVLGCWIGDGRPRFLSSNHVPLCLSPRFLLGEMEAIPKPVCPKGGASTTARQASDSYHVYSLDNCQHSVEQVSCHSINSSYCY